MGLVCEVPPWLARGVCTAPCMLTSELAGCACAAGGTRFLGLYLRSGREGEGGKRGRQAR